VHGWIDNASDIAIELGMQRADVSLLYATAVERWGIEADRRLIGSYCSVVELPDGSLRLSRSPWTAPPLVYANDSNHAVIASVPRALFAAGVPQRLNLPRFADNLFFNLTLTDEGWFEGTWRVPQGAVVTLTPGRRDVHRWYDPVAVSPVRLPSDDAYLEAAESLLGEATSKALSGAQRPAMALSGGLDSPIVAAEVLRRLPPEQVLRTFTAVPAKSWDGVVAPGLYGDEQPWVERFAAMHPRLRPTFLDRPGGGFDDRADDMMRAMGIGTRNFCNLQFFHAVFEAARVAGCDRLLDAEMGNDSFSNDARWSYVEFLRTGRWRQLKRLLAARADDTRPMWRKVASLSLLRVMPAALRQAVRSLVHPERRGFEDLWHVVAPAAAERLALRERRGEGTVKFEYWRPVRSSSDTRTSAPISKRRRSGRALNKFTASRAATWPPTVR